MIRATHVARMDVKANKKITVYISSWLGYVDMPHFASFTPNIGKFMEYKGSMNVTGKLFDSPLRIKDGMINVSTKPGLGIVNANELFKDAKKV